MQVESTKPDGSGQLPRHVVLSLAVMAVGLVRRVPALRFEEARASDCTSTDSSCAVGAVELVLQPATSRAAPPRINSRLNIVWVSGTTSASGQSLVDEYDSAGHRRQR